MRDESCRTLHPSSFLAIFQGLGDRHGVTIRRGDLRRMNKHRLDLFGAAEAGA